MLKLNIGVEGARRVAIEAQQQAQRTGNATHFCIHIFNVYIYVCEPAAQPVFVLQERSWTAGPLFAARARDDGCGRCVRS